MKIDKRFPIVVFAVIMIGLGTTVFLIHKTTTRIITSHAKVVTSYPDEPIAKATQGKGNIISSTGWTIPTKPEIIKPDSQETSLTSQQIQEIWRNNPLPNLKQEMTKLHIDQKYYSYYYPNTLFPVASGTAKLTGDGISYPYLQSIGVGCGSCELQYIRIFIGSKTYSLESTWGSLFPRQDGKGFYITNAENDYATNVEKETLQRFVWNGNGFSEVGEKTIRFAIKN